VLGVIATFHDVQDRQPAEPWVRPRVQQIVKHSARLFFHSLGAYMSIFILQRRNELAAAMALPLLSTHSTATALACVTSCVYSFFSLHVFGDVLTVQCLLIPRGFLLPPLMAEPERALSVRQFWARWDVVIQKLLRRNVYEPLRKLGCNSHVAMAATFLASGVRFFLWSLWGRRSPLHALRQGVHVYPIFVGLNDDVVAAASMMGCVSGVERARHAHRTPAQILYMPARVHLRRAAAGCGKMGFHHCVCVDAAVSVCSQLPARCPSVQAGGHTPLIYS